MINFPEGYFKKETKWDFSVGEVMKRVWAAQLEVLMHVAEICERHSLTYYIFWGSLIGAARHHGFIPWDDDLDIAMLQDDYKKLLEYAKDELPPEYRVFNIYTDENWDQSFSRIINNGVHTDISPEHLSKNHNCPWLVGIDLFPLSFYPRDDDFAGQIEMVHRLMNSVRGNIDEFYSENPSGAMEILGEIEGFTGYHFDFTRSLKNQLFILEDSVANLATREESDYIIPYTLYYEYGKHKFLLEDMEPIHWDFEGLDVTIPKGYDRILRTCFGDYMIPIRGTASHDYPYFRDQAEKLGLTVDQNDVLYKQHSDSLRITLPSESSPLDISSETAKSLLPAKWYDKLFYTKDGDLHRKKVLLYQTSASGVIINSGYFSEKLKSNFEVFRNSQDDIVVWWIPTSFDDERFRGINCQIPDLVREYPALVQEYIDGDIGIYDVSGDVSRALRFADAFYGDEGFIKGLFEKTGRPIMIQNYEITML